MIYALLVLIGWLLSFGLVTWTMLRLTSVVISRTTEQVRLLSSALTEATAHVITPTPPEAGVSDDGHPVAPVWLEWDSEQSMDPISDSDIPDPVPMMNSERAVGVPRLPDLSAERERGNRG